MSGTAGLFPDVLHSLLVVFTICFYKANTIFKISFPIAGKQHKFVVRSERGKIIFRSSKSFQPSCVCHQASCSIVSGSNLVVTKGQGREDNQLSPHRPILRMSGAMSPLACKSSYGVLYMHAHIFSTLLLATQ